jgi:hypothetical protein
LANWDGGGAFKPTPQVEVRLDGGTGSGKEVHGKLGLSYTINLNLPATTEIEVFNAIFKSLREHLLGDL